jgi:hypothetical protein
MQAREVSSVRAASTAPLPSRVRRRRLRAERAGRRRRLRQMSVGAECVPLVWCSGPGRGARCGRARAERSVAPAPGGEGPAEAGTRALQAVARASTRGLGAALARLLGVDGCAVWSAPASTAAEYARTALDGGPGHHVADRQGRSHRENVASKRIKHPFREQGTPTPQKWVLPAASCYLPLARLFFNLGCRHRRAALRRFEEAAGECLLFLLQSAEH